MPRFTYNAPYTRCELVERARKTAQALVRTTVLLELNRKKHVSDDLLLLLFEEWFPRIIASSRRGVSACPLEFNLLTEEVETDGKKLKIRQEETESRIRGFFDGTGFQVLKFEHWVLERDRISVQFYVAWS